MKRLGLLICAILQLIALATLVSCGGGGGGGKAAHAPTIADLSYSPSSAFASPNGTVTVEGTMNVSDAGADVSSLRLTTSAGADLSIPLSWPAGSTSGSGRAQFVVPVDKPGTYTFEIWAVDDAGSASTRLAGSFEVVSADNAYRAPAISNLRLAPSTAVRAPGGTVTISGSVDFADAGADVAALRVTGGNGMDLTIPTPSLQGSTHGTATAPIVVSIDTAGSYTFDVWAVDSAGLPSNHLSGTFDVLPAAPAHAPSISNLRYSPSSATQAADGSVPFTVTVDFSDAGADVTWMRIAAGPGLDQTVRLSWVPRSATGTATATFMVPVQQAASYAFTVVALDGQGTASNQLTGSFNVLAPTGAPWIKLAAAVPNELFGVASNGHQYVAVGAGGTVLTSADAVTWQVQNSGVSVSLRSVAASATRFVAVGQSGTGQAIAIGSADGATWSVLYRGAPGVSQLAKVVWAGTQFIAVGQERAASGKLYGLVLTSPDGLTWTQRGAQAMELGLPTFFVQNSMTSVAFSGGLAVLTGVSPPEEPVVWFSSDLDTWTMSELTEAAVAFVSLSDITWGGGRFVAVSPITGWGTGAPTFVSTDGRNWQASSTSAYLPEMNAVTAGSGEFVAVGSSYRMNSADGLAWSVVPMTGCGNAVLWDGTRYVSVGTAICKSQ